MNDLTTRATDLAEQTEIDQHRATLKRFQRRADEEQSHYRVGNGVLAAIINLPIQNWRIFELAASKIQTYDDNLIENDLLIASKLANSEHAFTHDECTVYLEASEYCRLYGIAPTNGYRQFTKECLSLYETSLNNVVFNSPQSSQPDRVDLQRVLTNLTLFSDRAEGSLPVSPDAIRRDVSHKKDGYIWSCKGASLTFSTQVIKEMVLLTKYFTRIDYAVSSKMPAPAAKLFAYLTMHMEANKNKPQVLSFTLPQLNALTSTNYDTIVQYFNNFKHHIYISRLSPIDVSVSKCENTKQGKKYTQMVMFVSKKEKCAIIESDPIRTAKHIVNKTTRPKLIPRPRVTQGSHEEGVWARKNLNILQTYQQKLSAEGRELTKPDKERVARYKKILGEHSMP
ncbi:hypothetical protein AB4254_13670 [Vibrio breoganii]